jgi:CRP/FNR family transcriptional regulator, anaerobic regulatory protein
MARATLNRTTFGPAGTIDEPFRAAFRELLAAGAASAADPLLRTAKMLRAAPGDVLVHENQAPFAGVLVEGLLRIVVSLPDGRSASIHYVRPAAFVALPTLFTPTPLSVHAVTSSSAIVLDAATVIETARANADFALFVARQLAMAVARVPAIIEHFGFTPVQQRVASHLLALSQPGPGAGQLQVLVTHAALADYVGTAREVVSRTLRVLADDGLITIAHSRIQIVDAAGLREEAGRASMDRGKR